MADDEITVASTTDEMEDVEAAAEVTPQELAAGRTPAPQARNEEPTDEPAEGRDRAGRGGFQKRIDRLTREKYQNLDRIQQLESRLREIEAGTQSRTRPGADGDGPTPTEKPNAPGAERSSEEPRSPAANEEARAREAAEHQARQVHANFARDYEAALPKGSPERAELEQAAARTQAEVGGIHTGVAQIVMAMPNSIDVYAHLCTHPDDLRVLNASRSHAEALSNVKYMSGVLRGMVQAQQAQQAQPAPSPRASVSRAPAPITRTRGSAVSSSVSLEDSDYQTFKRAREQQEKNRYRY